CKDHSTPLVFLFFAPLREPIRGIILSSFNLTLKFKIQSSFLHLAFTCDIVRVAQRKTFR
ncbi:MAG: hypothetical protein WCB68_09180, partial [Pyrinomonadaceae bacterium]